MRKYKFRAWCPRYKCMFPNVLPFMDGAIIEIYDGGGYDERTDCDFVVMQSTGLYDKKGAEIFEGDIVTDGKHVAAVEYRNGAFGAIVRAGHYIVADLLDICDDSPRKNMEIIGNIHESPDLLAAKGEEG